MEEEVFNSEEALKVDIPADLHGIRLDAAAAHLFPDFSRSRLAEWIKAGRLQRNHQASRPKDKVAVDDQLLLWPETEDRVEWAPEPLPLDILYED